MTNLKSLLAFSHVLRHGSLQAAAERMNLSQPAVSRLISNLEHEVGLTLFHRDRRALRPTEEAQRFHRETERILAGVEHLGQIAADIRNGTGQTLRVIAMSRLAIGVLPQAVAAFKLRKPEVQLDVEMHHRRDVERWMSGRQFDIGFAPLPISEPSLDVAPLATVPLVAVASRSSSLGGRRTVKPLSAADLAEHPMIALTPDTLLQSQVDAIFSSAGIEPRVGMRVSSSLVACRIAATGVGFAITDLLSAHVVQSMVRIIPIEPGFDISFGRLSSRSQQIGSAAEEFTREMKAAIWQVLSVYDFASKA